MYIVYFKHINNTQYKKQIHNKYTRIYRIFVFLNFVLSYKTQIIFDKLILMV